MFLSVLARAMKLLTGDKLFDVKVVCGGSVCILYWLTYHFWSLWRSWSLQFRIICTPKAERVIRNAFLKGLLAFSKKKQEKKGRAPKRAKEHGLKSQKNLGWNREQTMASSKDTATIAWSSAAGIGVIDVSQIGHPHLKRLRKTPKKKNPTQSKEQLNRIGNSTSMRASWHLARVVRILPVEIQQEALIEAQVDGSPPGGVENLRNAPQLW